MAKTEKPQEEQAQETKSESEKTPKAFFITPLGGDTSDIRRSTDGLIDAVIKPALDRHGIELISPHRIKNPGNITRQIVQYILDCELVIANLTGLNANVMYELAIRHAKRKPVIVIAEIGTGLPFDIAAERTFFYRNDMSGVVELRSTLIDIIPVALKDESPENPVYTGLEASIIREQVEKDANPFENYVLQKLNDLTDSLSFINSNLRSSNQKSGVQSIKFSTKLPPLPTYVYHITLGDGPRSNVDFLVSYFNALHITPEFGYISDNVWSFTLPEYEFPTPHSLHKALTKNGVNVLSVKQYPF